MKLFVSDVDNTLIGTDHVFSEELITEISKINNNGDLFVLCSGRPVESLQEVATNLNLKGCNISYVSGYNGCRMIDMKTNEIIYDYSLSLDEVDLITTYLDNKYDYSIVHEGTVYSTNIENEYSIHEATVNNLKHEVKTKNYSVPKVVVCIDPDQLKDAITDIKQKFSNFTVVESSPFFIDITKNGISKATTLKFLKDKYNVKHEDTYGFGDNENDLELIKEAYNSVAVDNAKDNIKDAAKFITLSVDENGVAKYLNSLTKK